MAAINDPKSNAEVEAKGSETTIQSADPEQQKKKKMIGAVMCALGCICFIIALTRITNEDYKFYVEHYEDCMEGYESCMEEAAYAGMFSNAYKNIARTYEDMAEDDMKEIWKYRGAAIVCCVAGIGLIFAGYRNIKKS